MSSPEIPQIPWFLRRKSSPEVVEQPEYIVNLSVATIDAVDNLIRFSEYVFPAQPDLETISKDASPSNLFNGCLIVLKRLGSRVPFNPQAISAQEPEREQRAIISLRETDIDVINKILIDEIEYWQEGIRTIVVGGDPDLYETVSSRKVPGIMSLLHAVNGAFIQAGAIPRPAYRDLFEE